MYDTNDFRKNLKIEVNGEPFVILEAVHVKPGKGVAFVKTKMKSLISGRVLDTNYRSGDKVDRPNIESRDMQYLYAQGDEYVFMDTSSYEQLNLSSKALEDVLPFMKEQCEVSVLFHNGKPINIELPNFVVLKVVETDPGIRGNTAAGGTKPAKTETGHVVQVPLYLEEGEWVKVDTRTGDYVERTKAP